MADLKHLLVLRLEGALQSWGEASKWDNRGSASIPTKSGIVGLLGCALGLKRGDPMLLELSNSITVAVRIDRSGIPFTDFHTVTGNPMMAASGKRRSLGDTIITPRTYYQDAAFTVFIETTDELRSRLVAALNNPRWCIYLGRKNCVPSRPVLECAAADYKSMIDAVKGYPLAERHDASITYESESNISDLDIGVFRQDVITENARVFQSRHAWRNTLGGEPCT